MKRCKKPKKKKRKREERLWGGQIYEKFLCVELVNKLWAGITREETHNGR